MCQCDRHNRTSGVIWLTPLLVLPVFYRKWYPWYLLFYRCHSEPLELYLKFRGIFTHYFVLVYYHFLMRYAMQVRPLAVMRCPSVYLPLCLSRWYMHFVKTNKHFHFHFFHLWAGGRPHYDITRKMLFFGTLSTLSSYAPSGHIFTCRHITCTCLYKRTELQLSSSISFGDMRYEGVRK